MLWAFSLFSSKIAIVGIVIVILLGLIARVLLSGLGTLALDYNTFISWSGSLVSGGFGNFYSGWSDYLPGYLYILWILGQIKNLGVTGTTLLYKLPAILADLAGGYFIYRIVKNLKGEKWAIVASSFYIFNPAIIANSALWGQVDSLTALFALMAVYFTPISLLASSVSLAVGTLIKPQAAYVAPVVFLLMLKEKWNYKKILLYGVIGLAVFVLGFVPFATGKNIIDFVVQRISVTVGQYPYTSVNAFNFWGVIGLWKEDFTLGLTFLIPIILTIFAYFKIRKQKGMEYILLAIALSSSFMFLTRMHERHLLPAFAPMIIAASLNPLVFISYIGMSLIYVGNLRYSFVWITEDFKVIYSDSLIKLLSVLNVLFFVNLLYSLFKKVKEVDFPGLVSKLMTKGEFSKIEFPKFTKTKISGKKAKYILIGILVFAFASRILFLGNPPNEYFDEVYHAFTARTMLHGDPKAWEWWNTPPEGFAYEWTHPPFAKLAMVASMSIFGENSFGWRIPAALFGTASIFMVYLIAKKLFDDEVLALMSAFVLSLDGLHLVLSRIGMNDSYFLFFALTAIYFFLKEKDLYSALALGLAASSKWTVFWVIPILGVIFLSVRKKIKPSLFWFFVVPPIIYLASYIPMYLVGNHTIDTFIEVQRQMWWYHTHLKATHAYTSSWWSWPFLIRPVWLYTSGVVKDLIANIYAMGNPVVFWFGLASIITMAWDAVEKRNKALGLVLFSYLAFFVPWALSPRIMFLYHYLPSVPFLAIATAYILRKHTRLIPIYFVAAVLVFVYFYPHYTGIKVPVWLDNSYYWIDSWR